MDVKEVPKETKNTSSQPAKQSTLQKSVTGSIQSVTIASSKVASEAAQVDVKPIRPSLGETNERSTLNKKISLVNLLSDSADEIGQIVDSLDGIVEQASKLPPNSVRQKTLNKEAKQLAQNLPPITKASTEHVNRFLADTELRQHLEETLGRTLAAIFPDKLDKELAADKLDLTAEGIIETRVRVAKARQQIETLKANVKEVSDQLKSVVSQIEVGLQNSESANASIRDLDNAVRLASNTRQEIGSDPEKALNAFSPPDATPLRDENS